MLPVPAQENSEIFPVGCAPSFKRIKTTAVPESMALRLIEAQEAERSRIARQLHDDHSQRLAVLSLGLNALRHDVPEEQREAVAMLQRQAIELSAEIRQLSHELH